MKVKTFFYRLFFIKLNEQKKNIKKPNMSHRNNECRIYVGNLPPDIRTKDIQDLFHKFGKVTFVDLKNRRGPPFAFVEFEDSRYVHFDTNNHSIFFVAFFSAVCNFIVLSLSLMCVFLSRVYTKTFCNWLYVLDLSFGITCD